MVKRRTVTPVFAFRQCTRGVSSGLVSGCLSGEDSSDSRAPPRHPAVRPPSSRLRLDRRGQAYLKEVQRILAEVHGVSERQRRWPRRVRIVSVEAVAELWLLPRRRAR